MRIIVTAWLIFLALLAVAVLLAFVGALFAPVRAQQGCYQIDRFGALCIPSTGEIFVDVAGARHALLIIGASSSPQGRGDQPRATATPSIIILAHQKLASIVPVQSPEELRAWIHINGRDCCPHQNCFPAPGARLDSDGWQVPGMTGRLNPFSGKPWPFRETWACYYPHDPAKTLRCVFHPHPETS